MGRVGETSRGPTLVPLAHDNRQEKEGYRDGSEPNVEKEGVRRKRWGRGKRTPEKGGGRENVRPDRNRFNTLSTSKKSKEGERVRIDGSLDTAV